MRIEEMLKKNKSTITVAILALIILAPIGFYAVRDAIPQDTEAFLEKPDPKYKECVRDTEYMRLQHWVLLKEVRERVVREGKKVTAMQGGEEVEVTLSGCRDCHTNRSRFCNECHNIANVYLDCFGCHNYPETPEEPVVEHASKLNAGPGAHMIKAGH